MTEILAPQQAFDNWNFLTCSFGDQTASYLKNLGLESEILTAKSPQDRFIVVDKTLDQSNALIFAHTEPFTSFYEVQQATPRSVYVSRNWQYVPNINDASLSGVSWKLQLQQPEFYVSTTNSTPLVWTQDKADIFAKVFGIKPSGGDALHAGLIQALQRDNADCAYGNQPNKINH